MSMLKGQVFKNPEDIKRALLNNINEASLSASKKVDSKFGHKVDHICARLAQIYKVLDIVINYTKEEVDNIKFYSQMILWQGANSLVGALQLIRVGYYLEPHFLERHAIENLAITLVLLNSPQRYKDFAKGKLSGEKCIGEAKKIISQIGQIYGSLSDTSHLSRKWVGTYVVSERGTMLIGGGIVDEHMYRIKANLSLLEFLITIYFSGVELVFYNFIDEHRFWKKKEGEDVFVWSPSKSEVRYEEERERLMAEAMEEQDIAFVQINKQLP